MARSTQALEGVSSTRFVAGLGGLVLAIAVLAAPPAAAATEGTSAVEICGTLKEHRPATASAAGSLTMGTRIYAVAPGTQVGNAGVEIAVGRDLCVTGSVGRTSGQLLRYTFFWLPPDGQVCGNVLSSSPASVTISADFGALTLALGPGVASPQHGIRVCYVIEIAKPSGDATAVRSQPVDTNNEREWVSHCGTVNAYAPATAAAPGSITVGSKSWRIASGTGYTGDPVGDRTDRTTVGSNMCLRATLSDGREIIEYVTTAMSREISGTASEYTPPAGDRPGVLVLSYRSHFELKVPPAIADAAELGRGTHCYSIGVDSSGDAIATALIQCAPVGVAAGPIATVSPAAVASPTPSPSPTPTPAEPSPTALGLATATPAAPEGDAEPNRVPLVAGAAVVAALATAAVLLARRPRL